MKTIRHPAVAGMFYPADPRSLRADLDGYLAEAAEETGPVPKALIAPHAGYVYSGPVAAHAYARLRAGASRVTRVVLLAPAHRWPFYGLAIPAADEFQTPLGRIPVDRAALLSVIDLPQVQVLDAAFDGEHALEVHLPFLQTVLASFRICPFLVGEASRDTLAANLRAMMAIREWNQVELAGRSGVSQRMISHVLTKNAACSIETADALARPFGLHGWHLLIPNLPAELMQSGSLHRLVEAYTSASADTRDLMDRLLAIQSKASNSDPVLPA